MSDKSVLGSILLGMVAIITGGAALVLVSQALSGLGSGGLALIVLPVLILAGICAAAVAALVRLSRKDDERDG